ncbi:hypothetical protein IMZ31_19335 (plasmid) [Pontibacillus sp. ALD_SL1]|nr:hypothetical protein IMZ31_19335 [Pontibacillus sp. ALD_SL1]
MKTIDKARALAKKNGAVCLSEGRVTSTQKLEWRCPYGHIWEDTYSYMAASFRCKECSKKNKGAKVLKEAEDLARQNGGECLSNDYHGSTEKLYFRCRQGHEWATFFYSVKRGSWCPTCRTGGRRRKTIEDANALAKEHGGECLSRIYVSSQTKLEWKCQRGHIWKATYNDIQKGHWCPGCQRCSERDRHEWAAKRGGKCLSHTYRNGYSQKLLWECEKGHRWQTTLNAIKNGTWCPPTAPEGNGIQPRT